jgi:plastocyanin
MSTRQKIAIFMILTGLTLAIISGTGIVIGSVSAENNSTEQLYSEAGSNNTKTNPGANGTSTGGNTTNDSTAAGTKVSIVEEASEMGDRAYDPNPVKIKAGNTVTWTNDDSQIHTVTSGTGSDDTSPGKEFDSSMLSQNQTFSHKFDVAGEFSYFCQLHPTMVGKVVVS